MIFFGEPCMANSLKKYHERRDTQKSGEPEGGTLKKHKKPIFVVQKHDARNLHYDFRIEYDGVLKSWAVPKGPSLNPAIKRLAMPTDDHPLEYAKFEGIIEEGHYGAGQVIVWDIGTYENIKEKDGKILSMEECFKRGTVEIFLYGEKLYGAYALIRTQENRWLLIKMRDEYAHARKNPLTSEPESVLSGKTIEDIRKETRAKAKGKKEAAKSKKQTVRKRAKRTTTKAKKSRASDDEEDASMGDEIKVGKHTIEVSNLDKVLFAKPKITKGDLIEYYRKIAAIMLPYMKDRPLVMQRFPNGIDKEGFYQKDAGEYFPDWIELIKVKKKEGGNVHHVVVNSPETLIYLANQAVIVFHLWLSKIAKLANPDRVIFDLDPSGKNFEDIRISALDLKKLLDKLRLVSFVMTTGSRGLHIVIPIKPELDFDEVRDFAYDVASVLVQQDPDHRTLEIRKDKRKGKVFIDYLRNSFAATGVSPYSVRARPGAPVATPLDWKEVSKKSLRPDMFTIKNIFKRLSGKGDPWKTMQKKAQSLKMARKILDEMLEESEKK